MKKKLNIYCLQHVFFEGPGIIENWAKDNNHNFKTIKLFNDYSFPEIENVDMLIVMGGPMSFDDEDKYAWMAPEIEFIKAVIKNNKCVLGICLGAQIIAKALNGKAKHGTLREIGWYDIQLDMQTLKKLGWNAFPDKMKVFHWHGDTFDIPEGAIRWASSEAFPNQAFAYNEKVIGIQFHLEVTKESVLTMIEHCKNELIANTYVQDAETIISEMNYFGAMNLCMYEILNYLETSANDNSN